MSQTTNKHHNFVTESMSGKSVMELPGIGPTLADRLIEYEITMAYQILGKFLSCDMDQDEFRKFLKAHCDAAKPKADICYDALKEWCDNFL